MNAVYGHQWTSSFGEQTDPLGVWLGVLQGVTPAMLEQGVNNMSALGLEWPPNAVKFRTLCLPTREQLGIPTAAGAYRLAQLELAKPADQRDWSQLHPIVFWSVQGVGDIFNWKQLDVVSNQKRFDESYEVIYQRLLRGGTLSPVPQLHLLERDKNPSGAVSAQQTDTARRERAKLKSMFH